MKPDDIDWGALALERVRHALEHVFAAEKTWKETEADPRSSEYHRESARHRFKAAEREFGWQWRNVHRIVEPLSPQPSAPRSITLMPEASVDEIRYGWTILLHDGNGNVFSNDELGRDEALFELASFIFDKQPAHLYTARQQEALDSCAYYQPDESRMPLESWQKILPGGGGPVVTPGEYSNWWLVQSEHIGTYVHQLTPPKRISGWRVLPVPEEVIREVPDRERHVWTHRLALKETDVYLEGPSHASGRA